MPCPYHHVRNCDYPCVADVSVQYQRIEERLTLLQLLQRLGRVLGLCTNKGPLHSGQTLGVGVLLS